MQIWFGATSYQIENYIDYYRRIRDFLIKNDHIVLFDWIDEAYDYKISHPSASRGIKNVFHRVVSAINEASVVIIEYTVPNFSSSHQIIYSLLKHKPTLVMRLHKENSFSDSYLEAIESPFLTVKEYNLGNYRRILQEFLGESGIEGGLTRYNLVLDKKQKYYLDWISTRTKKSRSEIVRQAIEKIIQEDQKYKKYLQKL